MVDRNWCGFAACFLSAPISPEHAADSSKDRWQRRQKGDEDEQQESSAFAVALNNRQSVTLV
jgi:hypothetical protein